MKRGKTLLPSLLVALTLLSSGCSGCSEGEAKAKLPDSPAGAAKNSKTEKAVHGPKTAAASNPGSGGIEVSLFTGTVEAHRKSTLAPPFSALVKKVMVREGDYVEKGAPLVKLDISDMALQKKQAVAGLDAAKANYDVTQLEWERMKALYEAEGIAKSQWDMVDARLKAAKAGMDQAKVGLDTSKKFLGDATVRAPYSGLIVKKYVSEGERVTTMPPSYLVVLEEIDILDLRLKLPETEMNRFKEGEEITVRFSATGQEAIARISKVVGSIDPMTRTFSVIAEIDNRDHALKPGMFAEVKLGEAPAAGADEAAP
jgi:RND family efflux transporter MFP subunit